MNLYPLILDIPGFARSVIKSVVDQVWNSARGQQVVPQVVPLMMPPTPAHYSFPEPSDIVGLPISSSGNELSVINHF